MNTAQVQALRALLEPSGWLDRTRYFARALRKQARTPQGLLIVGTPAHEPWHLTAHLADESRMAGLPELEPTLVRWAPPPGAPPHLRVGIDRIERAARTDTLLVVSSEHAPASMLERVADARRAGAAIFALDRGDTELDDLAHESLVVRPAVDPVSFDGAQHLVSLAVGDAGWPRDSGPADALLSGLDSWPGGRPAVDAVSGRERSASPLSTARGKLARLLDAISGPQPGQ